MRLYYPVVDLNSSPLNQITKGGVEKKGYVEGKSEKLNYKIMEVCARRINNVPRSEL